MRKQRLDMKHLAIATSLAFCCHWNIAEGKDIIFRIFVCKYILYNKQLNLCFISISKGATT